MRTLRRAHGSVRLQIVEIRMSINEPVVSRRRVTGASDRSFGIVFAVVLAVLGLWPWAFGGHLRWWSIILAVAFAVIALSYPRLLAPLNRIWLRIGLALNRVINPIVMGLTYYCAVVPTGLVLKLLGKDPLRLSFDRPAASYWIMREPPGPAPGSMSKQF
jgi:hypothetical protein